MMSEPKIQELEKRRDELANLIKVANDFKEKMAYDREFRKVCLQIGNLKKSK